MAAGFSISQLTMHESSCCAHESELTNLKIWVIAVRFSTLYRSESSRTWALMNPSLCLATMLSSRAASSAGSKTRATAILCVAENYASVRPNGAFMQSLIADATY
ncbi:hypothetical protein HBH98_029430 [Parastagonospora nodorum]|nr:hypothetical protein HBH53_017280 [Parastagonospora nodorum]KAH4071022.1 hypothetical protein HBH50_075510 [Parastagonospora nodorum]KAH4093719.1 hypothetical protein HBH48_063760 [Parastagonospora nodorum]KAH4114221.1 hypothetical protein HBH47_198200 [Parastagonospora nodorum]KAH4196348.1 hypothetical protein HBI95_191200 [Parastagonospora nodorum]